LARSEAGLTLAEVLVAITILGFAVVALTQGLAGAARLSDIHRRGVNADTIVRDWAESIKQYNRLGSYQECVPGDTTPPDYMPNPADPTKVNYAVPAGYTVGYGSQGVQYEASSNLNLILLLDRSGSIAPAAVNAISAEKTFLESLTNTGTVVSLVSFSDRGSVEADPTAITGTMVPPTGTLPALEADIATVFNGGTNWDDGLGVALGQVGKFSFGPAPLVVMITDGDPTFYTDASNTVQGDGSTVKQINVDEAVAQANLLKNAARSHMFVIGVTGSTGMNVNNLKAISGTKEYTGTGSVIPFDKADWMQVTDFAALKPALQEIAAKLAIQSFLPVCPGSGDQGAQRLSLVATDSNGRASEQLDVVVRRP
jgi:uncharacterized protein YegL